MSRVKKPRKRTRPRRAAIDQAKAHLLQSEAEWAIPEDPRLMGDVVVDTAEGRVGLWIARQGAEAHVLRMNAPYPEPYFPCQVVTIEEDFSESDTERAIGLAVARAKGRLRAKA